MSKFWTFMFESFAASGFALAVAALTNPGDDCFALRARRFFEEVPQFTGSYVTSRRSIGYRSILLLGRHAAPMPGG